MTDTENKTNGFLGPITDEQVRKVQVWCFKAYGGYPNDIQVREVWQHYRGAETRFTPSSHFDDLTSIHISGIILAIEKAVL